MARRQTVSALDSGSALRAARTGHRFDRLTVLVGKVWTEEVRSRLRNRQEVALLDVREESEFALSHPLFAASMPLGLLELQILDRVPRLGTPVVLYGNGEELARAGAGRLEELGYTDVNVLQDGLDGWRAAGGELFRDVNVPSKAFGALVEARRHVPSISAEELHGRLRRAEDIVVLDGANVPGGELVYGVREIVPRSETLVVINCAGRARSIIGAQSLVNAGITNPVVALRNGTTGWSSPEPRPSQRFRRVSRRNQTLAASGSRHVADRAKVGRVNSEEMRVWREETSRTLYLFDVRTQEEYAKAHLPDCRSAPGGQLIQETDFFAPVRGARIVLVDDDGVRANMAASWLAQMGWEVHVWEEAFNNAGALQTGPWRPRVPAHTRLVTQQSSSRERESSTREPANERTDRPREALQAYLEWESGLVAQLERDGTHHFRVV